MISPFTLKTPPKISFGPGRFNELEQIIIRSSTTPLFVFGGNSFLLSTPYDKLKKIISSKNIAPHVVHIDHEPTPQFIDSVVGEYQDTGVNLVIGVGGGSVLDGAKAISAMLVEQAKIYNFLEGVGSKYPSGQKLPFIAIPTTSGTGSEATSNAVISEVGENGYKRSLRHDNYIPDIAIVDPELTLSCPHSLTIACGMDCFTQLVEGYLSTNGSHLTDLLALDGINAIKRSLRVVCDQGSNLHARTDLAYAALLSGIVLANAGLGTVHGFASVLGGLIKIPHGVVCGTLMACVNDYTLKALRKDEEHSQQSLQKYTTLGKLFSKQEHKSNSWYQDHFITELYLLTEKLNIPTLSKYGLTKPHIQTIVEKTGNKYNPIALGEDNLAAILSARLGESRRTTNW